MSLTYEAREAIADLDINKHSYEQGVENPIQQLDKLYLKDDYSAYEAYEQFEKLCRPKSVSISNHLSNLNAYKTKLKILIWHYQMVFWHIRLANKAHRQYQHFQAAQTNSAFNPNLTTIWEYERYLISFSWLPINISSIVEVEENSSVKQTVLVHFLNIFYLWPFNL